MDHLVGALASRANDSEEPSESRAAARKTTREALEALKRKRGRLLRIPYRKEHPQAGVVLVAPRGVHGAKPVRGLAPTTERVSFSQGLGGPVALECHGHHVADRAEAIAKALKLRKTTTADLRLAAKLHDAGKADPRFQTFLSGGGNLWNAPDAFGKVLAKSGRPPVRGAWKRADLPDGWRHEALSVQMARTHPDLSEAHDPALVLWLIGTHHGHGRPFFPHSDPQPRVPRPALGIDPELLNHREPGPHSPAFDFDGLDWPGLAEELRERYGTWRLAFYEAVLRLADHRASEAEKEGQR